MLALFVGKDKQQWTHTAALMAAVINCQRGPKDKAIHPNQLNPYRSERFVRGLPVNKETMGDVVTMFCTPEKQAEGRKEAEQNKRKADELRERLRQKRAEAMAC